VIVSSSCVVSAGGTFDLTNLRALLAKSSVGDGRSAKLKSSKSLELILRGLPSCSFSMHEAFLSLVGLVRSWDWNGKSSLIKAVEGLVVDKLLCFLFVVGFGFEDWLFWAGTLRLSRFLIVTGKVS
jgi:hypothetical protein